MKAVLIHKLRRRIGDDRFAELTVWQTPEPVPPSTHGFKYRLAFVVNEVCVLRYDNERGKGDHKHIDGMETNYAFTTLDQLIDDFWADVERYKE